MHGTCLNAHPFRMLHTGRTQQWLMFHPGSAQVQVQCSRHDPFTEGALSVHCPFQGLSSLSLRRSGFPSAMLQKGSRDDSNSLRGMVPVRTGFAWASLGIHHFYAEPIP